MQHPGDWADPDALTVASGEPGSWNDSTAPLDERGGGTAITVAVSLAIFFLGVTFAIVLNAYPSALPWLP